MKKFTFLFSFLVLLISCRKPETVKLVNKKAIADSAIFAYEKKLISSQIDSVFNKYQFNGSVAIFRDSVELYRKNNGFEDFKNKIKIDNNSVFAIASISKQFTAVLILLLEEQGKLSVDEKVSKYLKEFQGKEFQDITIKELLNHTSGISDSANGLISKPGKEFNYSNKGFRFLGAIIEKVSGKSYDENAKELFGKLGMKNSSTANLFSGNHFAGAYLGNSAQFQKIENMPKRLSNNEISIAAGGILSNIDDLHLWNNALYSGKIIKPETLKKFLTKSAERQHSVFGKMGYGYGIMMNTEKPVAYFHSGYVKGSPSLNIYYPKTKTSVIILSNIADEVKGKNMIFKPHLEIKKLTDMIENIK